MAKAKKNQEEVITENVEVVNAETTVEKELDSVDTNDLDALEDALNKENEIEKPVEDTDSEMKEVEEVVKIIDEVKENGEALSEISSIDENTASALEKEIEKVEEATEKCKENIKKLEKEVKSSNKDAILKMMNQRRFAQYWNGVSTGWE